MVSLKHVAKALLLVSTAAALGFLAGLQISWLRLSPRVRRRIHREAKGPKVEPARSPKGVSYGFTRIL